MTLEAMMGQKIKEAIDNALKTESDKLISEAVKKFEEKARKVAAEATMYLFNTYSVEDIGSHLIIKIEIKPPKGS